MTQPSAQTAPLPPRRLVVVRHGQALTPAAASDHDRPLSPQGVADARALGRWVRRTVGVPDLVLCSSALRTRQTWKVMEQELGGVTRVSYDPRAYLASAETWVRLVREVLNDVATCLLVGHAPGVTHLVLDLVEDPESLAGTGLHEGFPTAAAAVLGPTTDWSALSTGSVIFGGTSPGPR